MSATQIGTLSGHTIADRFKLGKKLGQGGYGAVYEATQISMKRRVAIKLLHAELTQDETVAKRFRAEAISTSQLTHPNSVVIYDFGRDESRGVLFLAMEYLEGTNLNDLIGSHGGMPLPIALHVVEQIAASLHDAHERGIIHRDIKPHNVMIIRRGDDAFFAKVIDFGIAKVLQETTLSTMEQLTRTGVMVGTPHYMAPEQIRDEPIDGRTDQYALAHCLYKMLTGRAPLGGGSPLDVACRQLTDMPPPLRQIDASLPVNDAFERAMARALSKERGARFGSVAAFVSALREAIGPTPEGDASWADPRSPEATICAQDDQRTPFAITQDSPVEVHTSIMDGSVLEHDRLTLERDPQAEADETPQPSRERLDTPRGEMKRGQRSTMLLFGMSGDKIREEATRAAAQAARDAESARRQTEPMEAPPASMPTPYLPGAIVATAHEDPPMSTLDPPAPVPTPRAVEGVTPSSTETMQRPAPGVSRAPNRLVWLIGALVVALVVLMVMAYLVVSGRQGTAPVAVPERGATTSE